MGLDMYAYKVVDPENPSPIHLLTEADYMPLEGMQSEELWYWRKHPNLHGWMEHLYYKKGGKAESFNSVNVVLTKEDLNELENCINAKNLPHTAGFFFGESSDEDAIDDLKFVQAAREAIKEGNVVYYTSWW